MEPVAFRATYGGSDNVTVELQGPERVLGRDGTHRPAYVLTIEGPPFPVIYHLDGRFLVVREAVPCANHDSPTKGYCDGWLDWKTAGFPAPLGIGLPVLLANASEELAFEAAGKLRRLHIDAAETSDGGLQIDVSLVEGSNPTSIGGRYVYSRGSLFPERITTPDGKQLRLLEFERGAALDSVPIWDLGSRIVRAKDQSALFPGWDRPMGDVQATVQEAIEALKNESSSAQQDLESGGCVTLASPYFGTGNTVRSPLIRSELFDISVNKGDGSGTNYHLEARRTLAGTTWYLERQRETRSQDCREVTSSPAAAFSAQDVISFAQRLPLSVGDLDGFHWSGGSDLAYGDWPASSGWHTFTVRFVPGPLADERPFVYSPYNVEFNANTGWLNLISTDSSDMAKLDTGPDLEMPPPISG